MSLKNKSMRQSFSSTNISIKYLNSLMQQDIKNENIHLLVQLVNKRNKTTQTIQKISQILEQALEFSYFKLLKSKLNQIDYNTIIQQLKLQFRSADSIIIEKKRRNDFFYVILLGQIIVLDEVEVQKQNYEGIKELKFQVINELFKGDTFGESSLVSFKRQTTARVQARSNCLLLALSFDIFNKTILKVTVQRKQQISNIFMNSCLFFGVDNDSIKDLAVQIYELKFGLNQTVYCSGSRHDGLYFVKNGIVEILQEGVKLVTISAGENFGVENIQLIDQKRIQHAVSKSSDLILYKIPYMKLKALGDFQEVFMKNLMQDFKMRRKYYSKLINSYKKVERIITSNSIGKVEPAKKKKVKKFAKVPSNPIWWGTARRAESVTHKPQVFEIEKENQNYELLGLKRINHLRYSVKQMRPEQCQDELMSFSGVGGFCGSFQKKVVNKNINSSDAELLKKKLIPQLHKSKLLKYAKSGIDECQEMFFFGY